LTKSSKIHKFGQIGKYRQKISASLLFSLLRAYLDICHENSDGKWNNQQTTASICIWTRTSEALNYNTKPLYIKGTGLFNYPLLIGSRDVHHANH